MRLSVRDLHYRYGAEEVLRGVDLEVGPGEIVCLVGPNGAGKSTVLKCLNLILKPSRGEVTLDGAPVSSFGRRKLAQAMEPLGEALDMAALQVHLSNLRRKIGAQRIGTLRGIGYWLDSLP